MDFDTAVDAVVRAAAADELEDLNRRNYPGISDHSWEAVRQRAVTVAAVMRPDADTFDEAYQLLGARAATAAAHPPSAG